MRGHPANRPRLPAAVAAAVASVVAAVAVFSISLLLAPLAWAGEIGPPEGPPTMPPTGHSPGPAVLAHTGLDIGGTVAVGFTVLVLGTALVCWAALRTSRRGAHD